MSKRKRKMKLAAAQGLPPANAKDAAAYMQQNAVAMANAPRDGKALTLDEFSNVLARIGYGSGQLMQQTTYENTRLSRDFMLCLTLYRSHWIIRKIVDMIAEDMCKNWYQVTAKISPENIDQLQRLERVTRTRPQLLQALKWGRLFGGGACVMCIKGHEDILDEPLDLDDVMPGSYKGLIPLDRWSGITPGGRLVDDISSPDFGLPSSYRVTLAEGDSFSIHCSRIIRFQGRDLPMWEKQAAWYWGISEVEVVFDELRKRDNTSWNIAGLMFLANIRVLTLPGMAEVLALAPGKMQQQLYAVLQAQNQLMSNMGMMVLPKDGAFATHQYTFAGINDIYESFMLDIAGASEIPVTKLFGRSPAGMNATGESDLQQYYDSIEQKQETYLRPALEKLLPVECMSLWGEVPDDLDFQFPSAQTVPLDKLAAVAQQKSAAINESYTNDLLTKREARKELRQMSDDTGLYSNISDEAIADTPDEYASETAGGFGEGPPDAEGGLPGLESGGKAPGGATAPAIQGNAPKGKISQLLGEARQRLSDWRGNRKAATEKVQQNISHSNRVQEEEEQADELIKAFRQDLKRYSPDTQNRVFIRDGYIAFDLDGTLAESPPDGGYDPYVIGKPLKGTEVWDLITGHIEEGHDVRILTARVAEPQGEELERIKNGIEDWCLEHLGKVLPISAVKGAEMERLYDDRAREVLKDQGIVSQGMPAAQQAVKDARAMLDAWREDDHPRDEDGKFTSGGAGTGITAKESMTPHKGKALPSHIAALKIPPAWTDVRYSEDPKANLLAIGKDAKGREQRIYSDAFVRRQQEMKHARVNELRKMFPEIREQNASRKSEAPNDSDCLSLIMHTGIRPGSDRDTKAKKQAYGATTLEGRHVVRSENGVVLEFAGKKGVDLSIPVKDPHLARMLLSRKKEAGNTGKLFQTDAARLRKYTHGLDHGRFKPKDFRTRLASDMAESMVKSMNKPGSEKEYKKQVREIAKKVAAQLGNTPTVALQSYIDPNIFTPWRKSL